MDKIEFLSIVGIIAVILAFASVLVVVYLRLSIGECDYSLGEWFCKKYDKVVAGIATLAGVAYILSMAAVCMVLMVSVRLRQVVKEMRRREVR